jgi:hypothetical protein
MRRSVVITVASVVVIVAVVGFLAFRTSGSGSQLSSKLLSANQVPSAWESESFQSAIKGTGCLASAMSPAGSRATAVANVLYTNDGSAPPEVGEEVATFRDVGGAFRSVVTSVQQCTTIHGDNPNSSAIFGSVSPLLLPLYGVHSLSVKASITDQAVPVTISEDVDFIEKGKCVIEMFEANIGDDSVSKSQFEKFISTALAKL